MWRRHAEKVSLAEEDVFNELYRRGLWRNLHTQHPFKFGAEAGVEGTWADLLWDPPGYAVFIDGEPLHLKARQMERDKLVDAALRGMGLRVERFRYRPPLQKSRLMEICDDIEDGLKFLKVE